MWGTVSRIGHSRACVCPRTPPSPTHTSVPQRFTSGSLSWSHVRPPAWLQCSPWAQDGWHDLGAGPSLAICAVGNNRVEITTLGTRGWPAYLRAAAAVSFKRLWGIFVSTACHQTQQVQRSVPRESVPPSIGQSWLLRGLLSPSGGLCARVCTSVWPRTHREHSLNARVYSTQTLESVPHNPVQGTRSKVSDQEVEGTQVSVNGWWINTVRPIQTLEWDSASQGRTSETSLVI